MNEEYETRVFTYPNMTVRVHYPKLSPEEQNRRMNKIKKAAEELLKEVINLRK